MYNSERTENIESAEKTVEIEIKDYIILKNLQIEISYSNYSPMKNTLNKTGIERYSFGKETITAKSAVFEPAEFIRNVDFFIEAGENCKPIILVLEKFCGFETVVSDKKW